MPPRRLNSSSCGSGNTNCFLAISQASRRTQHVPNLICSNRLMKIKTRVDLSRSWRFLLFATYLSVLGGLIAKQIVAQEAEEGTWRRTSRGWEYAHSVPMKASKAAAAPGLDNKRKAAKGSQLTLNFIESHCRSLFLASSCHSATGH